METEEQTPIFVVCRPNCVAVVRGGETLGTFTGPEAEGRACLFRRALHVQEGLTFSPASYQRIGDPLGAIIEGHHDSKGMTLLRDLVNSIGIEKGPRNQRLACWDHMRMFQLRDFLEGEDE